MEKEEETTTKSKACVEIEMKSGKTHKGYIEDKETLWKNVNKQKERMYIYLYDEEDYLPRQIFIDSIESIVWLYYGNKQM